MIRVAHDLALALDHIHRRGLVHRDLKSANVLVLPDGRVKLLDFGTARISNAREQITKEGEFIGTFAYASPEQLTGRDVDHRSDLYSLGVLLYRLATRQAVRSRRSSCTSWRGSRSSKARASQLEVVEDAARSGSSP